MTYRGLGRYYCPDDAPGLTAEEINRHNSRAKPLLIKNAKAPLHQSENSDYRMSEAAIFRTVIDHAGVNDVVDQNGARVTANITAFSLGAAGIYLGDLLADSGARLEWRATARTKLLSLAAQIIAAQTGGADTDVKYGSVVDVIGVTTASTSSTAMCGRALLRAYAQAGTASYLAAAEACAMFCRRMQRCDLQTPSGSIDDNGNPLRTNGFSDSINSVGNVSSRYFQDAAGVILFFKELRAIRGGSYQYGSTGLAIQASIDQIISDAVGFYFDGAFIGTPLLTAAVNWGFFDSKSSAGGGTNTFQNQTLSSVQYQRARDIAFGIAALYAVEGYSARVSALIAWLQSFTGFDATFAPTANLAVVTKTAGPNLAAGVAGGAAFDLAAAALLAPVLAAGGTSARNLKDTVAGKRPLTASSTDASNRKNGVSFPYASIYTGPTGRLATDNTAAISVINVGNAAIVGGIYRLQPRALDTFPDGLAAQIGSAA